MIDVSGAVWFKLSQRGADGGVACDEDGAFVGSVPLLRRTRDDLGRSAWAPRALSELNLELGKCYGLPIDASVKLGGLLAVANALNQGRIALAQVATLHLRLPDCPPLAKGTRSRSETIKLATQLWQTGVLKTDWDPTYHPRWPVGDPEGRGGEFRPSNAAEETDVAALDRSALCNERCYPLLERRKTYGWSDKNKYDYHKCMDDCMREAS